MKYILGSLIGKGSDGEVYEVVGKDKIIKFIQPQMYGFENYLEAYILLNLIHLNLMNADLIEIDNNGLIKIVQRKAECDLGILLHSKKLSKKERLKYIKDLVNGVAFLNSHGIIHGDIKPTNLLIFKGVVKLNDFSLTRLNSYERTNKKLYTYIYRPPECFFNKISLKSDIWALGCTIYEIYYGQPYHSVNVDNILYHLPCPSYYNPENEKFNGLLSKMICEDRINIDEVCAFFKIKPCPKKELKIDFDVLCSKVFSNKVEHLIGKIKMNKEELLKEKKLFAEKLKSLIE